MRTNTRFSERSIVSDGIHYFPQKIKGDWIPIAFHDGNEWTTGNGRISHMRKHYPEELEKIMKLAKKKKII